MMTPEEMHKISDQLHRIRLKAERGNGGPMAMMSLAGELLPLANALANMADYVLFLEQRLTALERAQ
jgi:hypothetical protein